MAIVDSAAARAFITGNARLLDRRLCAVVLDNQSPTPVIAAVKAYQNADGGFGNALEPDKRAPQSQPLDTEIALEYLVAAGIPADDAGELIRPAVDWLESVADASGAVPPVFPSIAGHPRADHWQSGDFPAGVNPTAAIAAHLLTLGIGHRWIDQAVDYCFGEIEADRVPAEAHALLTVSRLLAAAPDDPRSAGGADAIGSALSTAAFMHLDPGTDGYGVTPLDFAPTPGHPARSWFDDAIIDGHLDRLARAQQDDGGWPISWRAPSAAAFWEWRGMRTLSALRVLTAYGRA